MNGSHALTASAPVNGTGPKPLAAVCCSESCRSGLCLALSCAGGSKFAGSARTTLGADFSAVVWSLQRYHQAMSCGFTNDTVVHHGRFFGAFAYHALNWAAIIGSTRQPCPGRPSGEGEVPPEDP